MADILWNPLAGAPPSVPTRMKDCGDGTYAPIGMSVGPPPIASLTAVSATGPGTALDNNGTRSNHVMAITSSAGVTAGAVTLQGSMDNVNWFNLASATTVPAAGATTLGGNTTLTPVRYLRANITTTVTGGTVTVYVAST